VSKVEQKEVTLEVGLPPDGFRKSLYFNRFRVEREEGFCLVQFGLISASALLDTYSCSLPKEALEQNRKSLLEYLNRIGRPAEKPAAIWKGAPIEKQVDVADIIAMAFRGEIAETCLYVFSICSVTRLGKSGTGSMLAQPLALLRCGPELQRRLIESLYEE
jgi:hypothetical protein